MKLGRLNNGERLCLAYILAAALICAAIRSTMSERDTEPFGSALHVGSAR